MVDIKKFKEIDLYELIGVEVTATENDVSNLFYKNRKFHKKIKFFFVDPQIIS